MMFAVKLAGVILAILALYAAMLGLDRRDGRQARDPAYVVRLRLPDKDEGALPRIEGPLDASRPLVVIDAGHGGRDPGASHGSMTEKQVTLALAQALRDALLAPNGAMGGTIRVALTRDADRYLSLATRGAIARRLGASLFLSIHADSAANPLAGGATVYTLSERGSGEAAARLAASENATATISAAGSVNGTDLAGRGQAVNAILVDLARRQAAAGSDELARLILREGAGQLHFREQPEQSAAFAVLKLVDVPSILFEAGYISNDADAAALSSPEGRRAFAEAMARAIRVWCARGSANLAP